MKIVSTNSDETIQASRAVEEIGANLRIMTSNLLRVVAGCGEPWALLGQIQDVAALLEADSVPAHAILQEIDGRAPLLDFVEKTADDGVRSVRRAEWHVYHASLRVVAAALSSPRAVQTNAKKAFFQAVGDLQSAQEERLLSRK